MVWIPGGTFRMGSEEFYVEESPVHEVAVDSFWIDRYQVTNEHFARFVAETGYLTVAKRPLNPADFPGAPVENLVPGSMVFHQTKGPVEPRCRPKNALRYVTLFGRAGDSKIVTWGINLRRSVFELPPLECEYPSLNTLDPHLLGSSRFSCNNIR